MRNLRLLALLAPALLVPVACEDSSSSQSATFNPEAGPGFEAGPSPEAGPVPEGGTDAPVAKGATVTVLEGALPRKDVRVIGHDATGAVIGETKTDATGKATLAPAPSSITVLQTRPGSQAGGIPVAVTFLAVEEGDKLVATLPSTVQVDPSPVGNYSVSFTAPSPNAPNVYAQVGGGCGATSDDVSLPALIVLYPGCDAAQNAVLASASNGGGLQEYSFAKNVVKPAVGATRNVGPLTFASKGATKVIATNLPANTTSFANLYMLSSGASFDADSPTGTLDSGGITYGTATGFADAYQTFAAIRPFAQLGSTSVLLRREATAAAASETLPAFDFGTALPFVTNATATNVASGRPDVTTISGAALTAADGGVVTLVWNVVTGGEASWTFVVPPSSASFKVPVLPADAGSFVPNATAFVDDVTFFEATQLPGYKELKALPVSPLKNSTLDIGDGRTPLPAAGTVRITRWTSGRRG